MLWSKSRWTRPVLVLAGLAVATLCGEIVLRTTLPRNAFVDVHSDEYFLLRLRAAAGVSASQRRTTSDIEPDPYRGWRVIPMLRLPGPTSSNSKGLRGSREYSYGRTAEVGRIVVLGDSFTYGLHVADAETYPAQMERMLGDWEVLNLGVNGYGTDQQLLYWLSEGRKYEPDIVILGYYLPDFHRNANRIQHGPKPYFNIEGGALKLAGVPVPSRQEVLDEEVPSVPGLRITRAAYWAWHRLRDEEPDATFQPKVLLSTAILAELKRSCDELGSRLVVLSIPHHWPDFPETPRIEDVVISACRALDIPVLRFTQSLGLADEVQHAEPVYGENKHWTAFAHAIVAKRVVQFLQDATLIPAANPARP